MKRAPKAHSKVVIPFSRVPRLTEAGLLFGMLVAGLGCSGEPAGASGAAGTGAAPSPLSGFSFSSHPRVALGLSG